MPESRNIGFIEEQKYNPNPPIFLGIGISSYANFRPLNNASFDIKSLLHLLSEKYQFEKEDSILLLDEKATKNGILSTLDDLNERLTLNDSLLIYYSGHSYFHPGLRSYYWVPFDAQSGETSSYINVSSLSEFFKRMSCKHIFLISDASLPQDFFITKR